MHLGSDGMYDMRVDIPASEIAYAAREVLEDSNPETDAWLADIIADRYANMPRNMTIKQFLDEHLIPLAKEACKKRRELINGYGGNVQKRA